MSNNQHTSTAKTVQQTVTNIYEISSTLAYAYLTSLDIDSYSVLLVYNKYTRAINNEKWVLLLLTSRNSLKTMAKHGF